MYCTVSARVVQRYVLDQIPDARLKIYVVWGSYKERETVDEARFAAPFVPDPRATHFWTASTAPGDLFQEPLKALGLGPLSAWDSFLLFAPEARWKDDTAPTPVSFMHRQVKEKPLNGLRLHEQVRSLLTPSDGKPAALTPR
jgi:hypothetical protein